MKNRILLLFSVQMILWATVLVRGAFIQIIPNERLQNLKRRQFETSIQIRSRRGAILDRNGKELASSVPSYSLFADPRLVEDPYTLAWRLSKTLKLKKHEVLHAFRQKHRRFVWLKRQLPEKQMQEIKAWNEQGLGFLEESKRVYPNGSLLAQTLGFVGADGRGLEGLELQYDKQLRGGWKNVALPRDARGRPLLPNGRLLTDVPDGSDLQTTIDGELQFILEQELQSALNQHKATRALGIVMDPNTFELLAMATYPSFDLNNPSRVSNEVRRNRVVADAFEPGSVMKAMLMAAALEKKVIKPSSKFNCEQGRFKVGDKWISEADGHKFGTLTATEILSHSSNIGATKIAFELGAESLFETLLNFGFGQRTGIELPGEAKGIVNPLPWRPHLLSNISFGHGITATPLQLVSAYSAIANGGFLKTPILVKAFLNNEKHVTPTEPSAVIRQSVDPLTDSTLKLMLSAATGENSTGSFARIPGYPVAGKTGTAQKVDLEKGGYYQNAYISSFIGMVPVSEPRFVIYIALDDPKNGHYGGSVAAPVFARVAQFALRRAGVTPVLISEKNFIAPMPEKKQSQEPEVPSDRFPRLIGMTLREALAKVKEKSTDVRVRGSGWVVRTQPEAGDEWSRAKTVTLVLENPD